MTISPVPLLAKLLNKHSPKTHSNQLTVFCDFDGPIVDVSDRYYWTYKLALEQIYQLDAHLVLRPLMKEQFWQMKQERVCDVEIAMRSGLHGDLIDQFLNIVKEIVNRDDLLDKDRIHGGVQWALGSLHAQGAKLVLVTLRRQTQASEILNSYGLKRLFTAIYGTKDVQSAYANNAHEKTALLQQAMAKYGTTHSYMIGDTEADILAADGVGIPSIAVTCGIRSHNYLQKFNPDYIYPDLLCATHALLVNEP